MTSARAPISLSSFTYPWDLVDLGVADALTRMRDDGFDALDLTVAYHPLTALTPAPGRRLTMIDEGGVFFPARMERYGRIKPLLWPDDDVLRAWPQAVASDSGLRLNGWTVCMFQPWLARRYPDCARTLPTGQTVPSAVCPSAPDVREFIAALVGDLVSQFPVSMIQLEGITSLRFDAGWRLARILVDVTPWQRRLLNLCFCPGCVAGGVAAGVDVDGLRERVVRALEVGYAENGLEPDRAADEVHEEWLARDLEYAAYLPVRDAASAALVEQVAAALVTESPATELAIWGPDEFDGTRTDLARVLPHVQAIQTRNPVLAPDGGREARSVADAYGLRVRTVHWCGGYIGPSFGSDFEQALAASVALPAEEINLFNWGMLSPSVARQIVPLVRRLEAELG